KHLVTCIDQETCHAMGRPVGPCRRPQHRDGAGPFQDRPDPVIRIVFVIRGAHSSSVPAAFSTGRALGAGNPRAVRDQPRCLCHGFHGIAMAKRTLARPCLPNRISAAPLLASNRAESTTGGPAGPRLSSPHRAACGAPGSFMTITLARPQARRAVDVLPAWTLTVPSFMRRLHSSP